MSLPDYSYRRSSSESYETQCSGCFTESTGSFSLSPDWPMTLSKFSNEDYKPSSSENSERTSPDSVVSVDTESLTKLSFIQVEENVQPVNLSERSTGNDLSLVSKHTYQAVENNEVNFNPIVNASSPLTVDNKECKQVPSNPLPVTVEISRNNVEIKHRDKEKTDVYNSIASNDNHCGAVKRNGYCKKEMPANKKLLPLITKDEDGSVAPAWMISPELLALRHNLIFPESVTNSPVVRRAQRCCRKFSVDLSEYK